ncbi:MAG: T9SS type A sorting domain-containing protein [Bacteroidia bacterium]
MRNTINTIGIALLLSMGLGVKGQVRGTTIYDQIFSISGRTLGARSNGETVLGGVMTNQVPLNHPELAGFMIESNDNPSSISSGILCDFNETPNGELTSVADAVGTKFNAVVGFTRVHGRGDQEGFFYDVTDPQSQRNTAVFWSSPGNDIPRRVLELPDHSFVVVGSMVESLSQCSFITRLKARPDYSPVFNRRVGNRLLDNTTVDEAVDVAQMPDGNLLILGNTIHYSSSGEGSIYLLKMGLDGLLHQFRTFTIGSGVLQPRATDMTILSNGTIIVIGNTNIANSSEHKGFIMTLPPDFTSATFLELSLNPQIFLGMEMTGICPVPNTNSYYCTGTMFHLSEFNFREKNPFILRANPSTGIEAIRKIDNEDALVETYEDITIRDNGLTLETIGITEESPAGNQPLAGEFNIITDRMQLSLFACNSVGFLMTQLFKTVTPQLQLPASVSVNHVTMGTMKPKVATFSSGLLCAGAKRDDHASNQNQAMESPRLYPNPAGEIATLAFPQSDGPTSVEISDALGNVLLRMETTDSQVALDLRKFAKGLLLIRTHQNGQVFTQKLIHQ